jgi:hypothetical protein
MAATRRWSARSGMLAGFCGTLMTPMAANFNLVPVTLLELKDPNAVIKAQIPTALPVAGDQHPLHLVVCVLTSPPARHPRESGDPASSSSEAKAAEFPLSRE